MTHMIRRPACVSRVLVVAASLLPGGALTGCHLQDITSGTTASSDRPSLKAARDALAAGSAENSLAIAKGVLESEPDNVAALATQGDALAALGNRRDAEFSYRHAQRVSPHDVRARLGLGKLQLQKDAHGAEMTFRAILADNPNDPAVLTDLGVALDMQARHHEAQDIYRRALTIAPDLNSAHINLAFSMALTGQALQAEEMLRDVAVNSPASSPRVRADYALAQLLAGHKEDAVNTLRADMSDAEAANSIRGMEAFVDVPPTAKPGS